MTPKEMAERFREAGLELRHWRRENFPIGCVVQIGADGNYGLASAETECQPDKIPIYFENGNTWWKPIETIRRVTDLKSIPPWVRRMKLQWHGYKI